ncbi:MAG: hypothetical protein LVQ75_03325 [Candidatus Babeliales bacterium]|jgi:Zn-dependent protease with chaperone function
MRQLQLYKNENYWKNSDSDNKNAINLFRAFLRTLFADHPTEENRIERLKKMSGK